MAGLASDFDQDRVFAREIGMFVAASVVDEICCNGGCGVLGSLEDVNENNRKYLALGLAWPEGVPRAGGGVGSGGWGGRRVTTSGKSLLWAYVARESLPACSWCRWWWWWWRQCS